MTAPVSAKSFDTLIAQPFAVGDSERTPTLSCGLGTIAEFAKEKLLGIDSHAAASL